MADNKDEQLTDEELAQLQLAEENENAVDRLVQELGCPTRRIRQFAARVLHLLAERDAARRALRTRADRGARPPRGADPLGGPRCPDGARHHLPRAAGRCL